MIKRLTNNEKKKITVSVCMTMTCPYTSAEGSCYLKELSGEVVVLPVSEASS